MLKAKPQRLSIKQAVSTITDLSPTDSMLMMVALSEAIGNKEVVGTLVHDHPEKAKLDISPDISLGANALREQANLYVRILLEGTVNHNLSTVDYDSFTAWAKVNKQKNSDYMSALGKKGKEKQDKGRLQHYKELSDDLCEEAIRLNAESHNVVLARLDKLVSENGIAPYVNWSFDSLHKKVREKLTKKGREDLCTKGRPKKVSGLSKEKFTSLQKETRQKNK